MNTRARPQKMLINVGGSQVWATRTRAVTHGVDATRRTLRSTDPDKPDHYALLDVIAPPAELLAPRPPDNAYDGLLLAPADPDAPVPSIELTIGPRWDNGGTEVPDDFEADLNPGDQIQIFLKRRGDADPDDPYDDVRWDNTTQPSLPVRFTIKGEDLGEGAWETWIVALYAGLGTDPGVRSPIIIDRTAPGFPNLAALKFDPADEIEVKGIRNEILRGTDPDKYLYAEIAGYEGLAPGDRIYVHINGTKVIDGQMVMAASGHIEVRIPEAGLAAIGDTQAATFTYDIHDRANNDSPASDPKTVAIILTQIEDLSEPTVPAYDNDVVTLPDVAKIDLADARGQGSSGGFIVSIARHPQMLATDSLLLHVGAENVSLAQLGAANPIQVIVPFQTSLDVWSTGSNEGADDVTVPAKVSYDLLRGAAKLGGSPAHDIAFNLYAGGGVDPDPETPEDERLQLPKLVTKGGAEDQIPANEFTVDASIEILTLSEAAYPPVTQSIVEGDTIMVNYGGIELAEFDVPAITDTANPLVITLPAAIIAEVGSAEAIPLYYRVVHPLVDGGANTFTSGTKNIKVFGTDRQPGGGSLLAGSFPSADAAGLISRQEIEKGTFFEVTEDYLNRDADDLVVLVMKAFLPGTGHSATADVPIPSRDYTAPAKSAGVFPETVRFFIPKEKLVYPREPGGPSQYFHFDVTHVITKRKGDTTPVTSAVVSVRVDGRGNP